MSAPTRPIVRYHGGKWRLAPWIISHFPEHRVYVEPFGGGGSVLLRKPRSYAEVYNDLDGEIVNVFRVARDCGEELRRALELTPFARDEFMESYAVSKDPLEQARRTIARSFMGFGSAAVCKEISGFRANSTRAGTTPAHDWRTYPGCFAEVVGRLQGVVIEHRGAITVMTAHDGADTLHYCDPPYVYETRGARRRGKSYKHELSDDDHRALADFLHSLAGMVIVSGYPGTLYDSELYADWRRIECPAMADGAKPRREVLWFNSACAQKQLRLIA